MHTFSGTYTHTHTHTDTNTHPFTTGQRMNWKQKINWTKIVPNKNENNVRIWIYLQFIIAVRAIKFECFVFLQFWNKIILQAQTRAGAFFFFGTIVPFDFDSYFRFTECKNWILYTNNVDYSDQIANFHLSHSPQIGRKYFLNNFFLVRSLSLQLKSFFSIIHSLYSYSSN